MQSQLTREAPGRKAFVDPESGRIAARPVQNARPDLAQNDMNSSRLLEAPGKTRSGGVKVHLQGRFRSNVSASIGPDGRVRTQCQIQAAASAPLPFGGASYHEPLAP